MTWSAFVRRFRRQRCSHLRRHETRHSRRHLHRDSVHHHAHLLRSYRLLQVYRSTSRRIDLLVSDRIKETLSPACLRHVLSTEGTGWFAPEKLTEVIDTYENSQMYTSHLLLHGPRQTSAVL